MLLYWKKYEKVEKEHRKRAEKEAMEQRKLDDEFREVLFIFRNTWNVETDFHFSFFTCGVSVVINNSALLCWLIFCRYEDSSANWIFWSLRQSCMLILWAKSLRVGLSFHFFNVQYYTCVGTNKS